MKPINLSLWQTQVRRDSHRYKVINCGRRAGKSYLVSVQMLHFATENDKSICWYVSPNYKQSKSIMWAMLRELIPTEMIRSKNETELKFVLVNGSEILLKGAEDPDSLRGVRIDFCVFDETAFIDKWDEVWKVIRPTLIDSKAKVWFISTPNGFNHFKTLCETTDQDFKYFHFTTYDNPYLDPSEIDSMKKEMDPDSFAQEIMGEFKKMSGMIYKDFARETHMVEIPPLDFNYTFTRSLDFGYGHKTALLYFAVSNTGDAIYCYDGLYQSGLVESQIAEVVKTKDSGRMITNPVADSAQPMSIDQLNQMGAFFNPVEKGPDSVKHGITRVAELLKIRADTGRPTLMFNKNLTWIADEFEQYRWMEAQQDGVIKEVPYKVNDDACFTGDTIVNGKQIKDIGIKTGIKDVYEYTIAGEKLKATKRHKIITQRGIVFIDALRYNDIIWNQKQLFMRVSGGTDIQAVKDGLLGVTTVVVQRILEAKNRDFIDLYGKKKTDLSLMDTTFITLMAIPLIIQSIILSWLAGVNTLVHIGLKRSVNGLNKISKRLVNVLQNGLKQKKDKKEEKKWDIKMPILSWIKKKLLDIVICVEKNTRQKTTDVIDSAISTVVKKHYVGLEPVYNLKTKSGMYHANKILVSNCDAIRYFAMSYRKEEPYLSPPQVIISDDIIGV